MEEKGSRKKEKLVLEEVPLPCDELAERAVLGGMIVEPDYVARARLLGLKEEDFFYPTHRELYALVATLYEERGENWDDVTLREYAEKKGLDKEGIWTLVIALVEDAAIGYLWEEAVRRVKELSLLRQGMEIGFGILKATELKDLIVAKEKLEELTRSFEFKKLTFPEMVEIELERLKRAKESSYLIRGIATGFLELDTKTLGFEPGQLIIVGARPGMGKSSFMLSMALHMARKHKVGIFSLEMSWSQLVQRAMAIKSQVPLYNIRSGFVNDEDLKKIEEACEELKELNLMIDDAPVQTVAEIKAKAKWEKLEVVFIDYLQLIHLEKKRTNRQEEVAEISMLLKSMAKHLEVPVIAMAQLNRNTESRSDKRPTLADLRESGQIEQDADIILFIHRPDYYAKNKNKNAPTTGKAEIIVAKNRQGPTGIVELFFNEQTTGFYPVEDFKVAEEENKEEEEGPDDDIDELLDLLNF